MVEDMLLAKFEEEEGRFCLRTRTKERDLSAVGDAVSDNPYSAREDSAFSVISLFRIQLFQCRYRGIRANFTLTLSVLQ